MDARPGSGVADRERRRAAALPVGRGVAGTVAQRASDHALFDRCADHRLTVVTRVEECPAEFCVRYPDGRETVIVVDQLLAARALVDDPVVELADVVAGDPQRDRLPLRGLSL